ncbi:transcription initiation factor IIB [Tulasnella sp. 419]|nr:transcription initiation factor IIB [Tulasnella sp. 418]KAG8959850.1 transcription initiation factor IIB [Tulasnella sp. 419]
MARELQRTMAKGSAAKTERNLLNAYREINDMCEKISLPKTIGDIAKGLYKRADQEKILRGKSTEAVVACCIFIACRQGRVPRTFKEVCQLTNVPKKILGQCYKTLEAAFNLHAAQQPGTTTQGAEFEEAAGSSPKDLLRRYVNHLDLPVYIEKACVDLVAACREEGVAHGRSPVSIAGAAIYFVSNLYGQPKTAREIGTVAGVSESTIKLVYRLMYQERTKLVKKEWLDSGKVNVSRLPAALEAPAAK